MKRVDRINSFKATVDLLVTLNNPLNDSFCRELEERRAATCWDFYNMKDCSKKFISSHISLVYSP